MALGKNRGEFMNEKSDTRFHQCTPKKQGHWIYKFTEDGLDQYRCTGCGKWAIKVPKYGFIEER